MAVFRAYAEVLDPDDPAVRIYEAGFRTCPGEPEHLLAEVLRRRGGGYVTRTVLSPSLRRDIREVTELASDAALLAIADLSEVPVSLEHLRGLDPRTRIVIRAQLRYEADEGARLAGAGAGERRSAVATVVPDGTVFAGDRFAHHRRLRRDEPGSRPG